MNPVLYGLDVTEGARLLLGLLHDDVDDDPVARAAIQRAWDEGRPGAPPPFSWRFSGDKCRRLCATLRLGHTAVAGYLALLTARGLIRRAERDGRRGWELLGARPQPPTVDPRGSAQTNPGVRVDEPAGPDLQTPGFVQTNPAGAVPDTPPPAGVRADEPAGPPRRTPGSGYADPQRARAHSEIIKHRDDRTVANAAQTSSRSTGEARRGGAVFQNSPPDPLTARLQALASEIGGLFQPLDADGREQASRRIRADEATVGRLRRLLTPPAHAEIDVWVDQRIAEIREYCRDYAAICKSNGMQARWWGPAMLETNRPGVGKPSAWETLTRLVDAWRVEQATAEQRRRLAAARAAQDQAAARASSETRARAAAGELPADIREGFARIAPQLQQPEQVGLRGVLSRVTSPPARPGRRDAGERAELSETDEEQLRRRGLQRETDAARAEHREQHIRQRINAAFAEYSRVHGTTPAPAVAEEIRRRIRAEEQETGT